MIHVLGRYTTPPFPTHCQATELQGLFFNSPVSSYQYSPTFPHQHYHNYHITIILSGFCSGPCVPQPRRLSSPHEVFPTPPAPHTRCLMIQFCSYKFPLSRVSLATLGSSSHWQPPRAAGSPDSPLRECVRASPARVIPAPAPRVASPDTEDGTERSFYFRPVSRSPSRTRLRGRSSGSPPPSAITPPQSPPPRSHRSPFRAAPVESQSPSVELPSSEFHGILKHREGSVGHQNHSQTSDGINTSQSSCSDHRTPKKSILKVDSVEDRGEQALVLTRSSLKKDASYDRQQSSSSSSPGCQTKPRLGSSSSSSEDITTRTPRTFSDVIIDPVPGQGRRSAPEVIIYDIDQPILIIKTEISHLVENIIWVEWFCMIS